MRCKDCKWCGTMYGTENKTCDLSRDEFLLTDEEVNEKVECPFTNEERGGK